VKSRPADPVSGYQVLSEAKPRKFFGDFALLALLFCRKQARKAGIMQGGRLRRAALQAERAEKKSALQAKQIKIATGGNIDDVASDGKATDGPRPSCRRHSLVFEES